MLQRSMFDLGSMVGVRFGPVLPATNCLGRPFNPRPFSFRAMIATPDVNEECSGVASGRTSIKFAEAFAAFRSLAPRENRSPNLKDRVLLARISGAWLIAVLGGTVLLRGQSQPNSDDPISTDRPAVAASSVVVPRGSLQVENGLLFTSGQGQRSLDGPETSLRFGVTANTELRFSAPDYYHSISSEAGVGSGFGDITIGMKRQLGPTPGGFDVSLIVFISIPTGADAVSSHGFDPGLQLPWSRKLSANWSAAGQFALYWPTQADTRNLTGESTFLLDRQLTKPLDAFIEYAADFPQRGGPRHLLHFGAAYKITPRHQIDIHYGIGLSSAAVDRFIGIGYSFRLQALPRRH
jgi:hypothetical protein